MVEQGPKERVCSEWQGGDLHGGGDNGTQYTPSFPNLPSFIFPIFEKQQLE